MIILFGWQIVNDNIIFQLYYELYLAIKKLCVAPSVLLARTHQGAPTPLNPNYPTHPEPPHPPFGSYNKRTYGYAPFSRFAQMPLITLKFCDNINIYRCQSKCDHTALHISPSRYMTLGSVAFSINYK